MKTKALLKSSAVFALSFGAVTTFSACNALTFHNSDSGGRVEQSGFVHDIEDLVVPFSEWFGDTGEANISIKTECGKRFLLTKGEYSASRNDRTSTTCDICLAR